MVVLIVTKITGVLTSTVMALHCGKAVLVGSTWFLMERSVNKSQNIQTMPWPAQSGDVKSNCQPVKTHQTQNEVHKTCLNLSSRMGCCDSRRAREAGGDAKMLQSAVIKNNGYTIKYELLFENMYCLQSSVFGSAIP